jgi:5-methylthioadenosine/S-adenosylhomocysteine deaminase
MTPAGSPSAAPVPKPLLVRGARILTMDAARRLLDGDLLVRDGRIAALGGRIEAPAYADIVDARGRWLLPGLIQGHVHFGQTLFRGLGEDLRLLDWLRDVIWPLEAAHDDESAHCSTLLGGMEALRAGTTTVLDIGLVHGMDGLFAGIEGLGLRAWSGKLLMDRGEGAPARLLEEPRVALEAGRELAARWHGAAEGRIRYAVCPRFVYSCSPPLWEAAVDQARGGGHPLHTHAFETREEQAAVQALEHRSELDTLDSVGALSVPLKVAHGVWVGDAEAERLGGAGAAVIHCPASNLKLGSGVADLAKLRAHGIPVGLGCDGSPCNNWLDPLQEMRLAALLQKWRHGPDRFSAQDALALATIEGARALGADAEVGSLEVGKRADFVLMDLDDVHSFAADAVDPYTRIVFGADRTNVVQVRVDGRLVFERAPLPGGGRFPGLDVPDTLARTRSALAALLKRAGRG